ncbi:MAG: RHS repeat-associated core domain-containing protein [Ruminococcaceae bacterium]|nr:RHS repeat-associated core domain-containing protein [Oscillospiraceae bacterium]
MQYHGSSYAEDVWDVFWYEKNLQGDIVAVYNDSGTKLVTYYYDAFGYCIAGYDNNGSSTRAYYNPFRYRGYYYDKDLDLYYLNARYYDGRTGRFISPDAPSYLGANGDLNSYNLYAYCSNNPVMYADPEGNVIISSIVIGGFVGLFLGFTLTAYSDYIDDGDVFNGSIDTKDYVANTLVTGIIGLGVGYVAPSMSSFLSNSFTFAIPSLAGNGALSVTLTGSQVFALATITGIIHTITTNKSNGYWGQKYSDDHAPDHIHLKGPKTDIRIGRDGNPLRGQHPLNPQQRKALKNLWDEFVKLFEMG